MNDKKYYIGWDVGAWNCDKNRRSRDAIVILDEDSANVENHYRGNIRETINKSANTSDFITELLRACDENLNNGCKVILAIDAPLGFSIAFQKLINGESHYDGCIEAHKENPYLFRKTEQLLFKEGQKPLSAIKDMIGSQATKAMHVVAKFAPIVQSCGVWTDSNNQLTIIETYPAACTGIGVNKDKNDIDDALICAKIAKMFANEIEKLNAPGDDIPESEGWIWTLKESKIV